MARGQGTAPITYTRQWKRNGTNISGATASTYVSVSGDIGTTISATVTATNVVNAVSANAAGVGPITAAGSTTTFNPANLNRGPLTLSNGNLTITSTGTAGGARSTTSYSTGKKYVKLTTLMGVGGIALWNGTSVSPDNAGVYNNEGIVSSSLTVICITTCGTHPTNNATGGIFYYGSVTTHVIEILADLGAKVIWWRMDGAPWNNDVSANPATGTGGADWSHWNCSRAIFSSRCGLER